MRAPRISGRALRALVRAADADPVKLLLGRMLRNDLRIDELLQLPPELRGPQPISHRPWSARAIPVRSNLGLAPFESSRDFAPTASDFAKEYRKKTLTPVQVVERCFAASAELAARMPAMDPFALS